MEDLVEILDHLRIPVNRSERSERPGPYPYYGATGQVGWIDDFLFDGEYILLGEDGAPFLEPHRPKAYLVRGKFWVNNHAHVLKPRAGILASFLVHQLNHADYKGFVSGTTRLKLPQSTMRRIPIRVAPRGQQQRIVAEIDKHFTRISAGTALLERVQANLKRYRAAVLKAACAGRLVPTEAELGGSSEKLPTAQSLPPGWRWITLPQLGKLARGKSKHRPRNDPKLYGGRYPFIQTGDVRNSGGWIRSYGATYNEAGLAQSQLWPPGTLCITIAGNIAETGILTFASCFPDSVVGFTFDGDIATIRYVDFFLRTIREDLERLAPATAQKNINLDTLVRIPIPLPPPGEQKRIISEVDRRFSVLDELEKVVRNNLGRAENLRQSVLRSAFTGKLVPQDPNDGPASVLLERIHQEREATSENQPRSRGCRPVAKIERPRSRRATR